MISNIITGITGVVTIGLIGSTMITTLVSAGCRTTYETLVNFIPEKVTLDEIFEYITRNDILYKIERINSVLVDIKSAINKNDKNDRNDRNDRNDINSKEELRNILQSMNKSYISKSITYSSAIDTSIKHLEDIVNKSLSIISKLNIDKKEQEDLYFGNWSIRQSNYRNELSDLIYCNNLFDIRFEDLQKIINIYKKI